ncbi:MAG: hypothetical protein PSX37_11705, partial [bacterium]|nr:hypothetical protein [bacterium]
MCEESSATDVYRGVNGIGGAVVATVDENGPDTFTFHDVTGRRAVFFGHDAQSGAAKGQLWKVEDAGGHRAFVGHATAASAAISAGFDGSGRVMKAYDPAGREYTYAYAGTPSRLTGVSVTGGVTGTIGVAYSYYGSGAADGLAGDLQSITVTTPMTSGPALVRKRHFRYFTEEWSSGNPGHPHQIRMVIESEGVRRFEAGGSGIEGATRAQIAAFADLEVTYDAARRVATFRKAS